MITDLGKIRLVLLFNVEYNKLNRIVYLDIPAHLQKDTDCLGRSRYVAFIDDEVLKQTKLDTLSHRIDIGSTPFSCFATPKYTVAWYHTTQERKIKIYHGKQTKA